MIKEMDTMKFIGLVAVGLIAFTAACGGLIETAGLGLKRRACEAVQCLTNPEPADDAVREHVTDFFNRIGDTNPTGRTAESIEFFFADNIMEGKESVVGYSTDLNITHGKVVNRVVIDRKWWNDTKTPKWIHTATEALDHHYAMQRQLVQHEIFHSVFRKEHRDEDRKLMSRSLSSVWDIEDVARMLTEELYYYSAGGIYD